MSSNELKGDSQAAVDPEKGLVETQAVPVSYDGDVKAKASLDTLSKEKEKDAAVTTTTKEVVVTAKPSKPPPKPKKKVPLWIIWTLWFNTYRYITFPLQQGHRCSVLLSLSGNFSRFVSP